MDKHKSDQRCLVVEIIRRHILENENPFARWDERMFLFDWWDHIVYQEDFGPSFNPAWMVSGEIQCCARNMGISEAFLRNSRALRDAAFARPNPDWPAVHGTRDAAFDQLLRRTIFFDVV